MNKLTRLFTGIQYNHLFIFIIMACIAISMQCYFASVPGEYTRYNNYVIFKQSFCHLIENKNLYSYYNNEHYDLYKYSPFFAMFMGLFYYLPDWAGVVLFNLLNAGIFIIALLKLNFPAKKLKWMLLFLLLEMGISLTSTQTNLLMAGLTILAFVNLEKDNYFLAALCIALTVYIKLFGLVTFVLWLFYPNKLRFLGYSLFWMAVLALSPLIVITTGELEQQYLNWKELLQADHDASYGASLIGWLHSWSGIEISKTAVVVSGTVLFCIPLFRIKLYKNYLFRLHTLASILIWVVVFNHRGESPTYIIALAGVAIWYFSQPPTNFNKILLLGCLVFSSFSSTDLITPSWIINNYVEPYSIKAVFCCLVWFKLISDLIASNKYRSVNH